MHCANSTDYLHAPLGTSLQRIPTHPGQPQQHGAHSQLAPALVPTLPVKPPPKLLPRIAQNSMTPPSSKKLDLQVLPTIIICPSTSSTQTNTTPHPHQYIPQPSNLNSPIIILTHQLVSSLPPKLPIHPHHHLHPVVHVKSFTPSTRALSEQHTPHPPSSIPTQIPHLSPPTRRSPP